MPTTEPLAFSAIARAASGVRMPKPTQTGSWVCRLMRATASPTVFESAAAAPRPADEDPYAQLERLGKLRDAGVLTPEEFERKKAELLSRI